MPEGAPRATAEQCGQAQQVLLDSIAERIDAAPVGSDQRLGLGFHRSMLQDEFLGQCRRRMAASTVECLIAAADPAALETCPAPDVRAPGERPTEAQCAEVAAHQGRLLARRDPRTRPGESPPELLAVGLDEKRTRLTELRTGGAPEAELEALQEEIARQERLVASARALADRIRSDCEEQYTRSEVACVLESTDLTAIQGCLR